VDYVAEVVLHVGSRRYAHSCWIVNGMTRCGALPDTPHPNVPTAAAHQRS